MATRVTILTHHDKIFKLKEHIMSREEHRMSEEFKPIRITLSQEAFDRMEYIMKNAKFRSYSSTIEECIRVVFEIINEIYLVAGSIDDPAVQLQPQDCIDSLGRIIVRMFRFTGKTIVPQSRR